MEPCLLAGYTLLSLSRSFRHCVEVYCDPTELKDGYGQALDRKQACKDPNKKIVVGITDT